jgi:hypothetical protein
MADFTASPPATGGGQAHTGGGGHASTGGGAGGGANAGGGGGATAGGGGGVSANGGGGASASGGGVSAGGGGGTSAGGGGGVSASGGGSVSASGGGSVSASGGGGTSASGGGGGSTATGGGSGTITPPTPGGPACTNVTCNGHGTCYTAGTSAFCECDPGYYGRLSNQQCEAAAGTACDGITCGGAGTCVSQFFGGYQCDCLPGYVSYGPACVQENKLYCRNSDGSLAPRGSTRCSADDMSIDVCADPDGDGLVDWTWGVACAGGLTCSGGCLGTKCPDQPCPIGTACVMEAHGQPLGVCVVTCDCNNCANCGPDNSDHRWDDEQEACGLMPNQAGQPTQACKQPCPSPGDGCIPYNPGICWPIEGCFSAPP